MKLTKLSIFCAAALLSVACNSNAPAPAAEAEAAVKTVIEAGEQAPLADPGQKNFGGMHADPKDTARINAERRHRMDEMNRLRTVSFEELSMSDPYHLSGSGNKDLLPDLVGRTYVEVEGPEHLGGSAQHHRHCWFLVGESWFCRCCRDS